MVRLDARSIGQLAILLRMHYSVVLMAKTEVYSWRVESDTKAALEREARKSSRSMGALLHEIVHKWLADGHSDANFVAQQKRLQAALDKCIGIAPSGNPKRSQQVRETVRAAIAERHARTRPH